jgi:hypothetical protein
MIKFFRKIRKRLLTENKLKKYLLYAIGEIVLVVIGILIALQLNNWNEVQKLKKLEKEYYCRLLEDAVLDIEQINDLITSAQDRLMASNRAIRVLLQPTPSKVEVGTEIYLATKAIYSDFKPNNSAFEDLKSGANLNIISDKSVIKALNQYFNKVEELKSIIMVNGKHAVDILYAHEDNFANGSNQASLLAGRFSTGLELDLRDAIQKDAEETLSAEMKTRLLHEALEYVSVNTRQVELYGYLLEEIKALEELLQAKCPVKE